MEILTCEHFKLTPAIRRAVHKRASQIERYFRKESPISFFLKLEKGQFETIINLQMAGKTISSHCKDENFYKSLRGAKVKLLRQFIDWRKKKKTLRHSTGLKEAIEGIYTQEPMYTEEAI